MSTPTAEIPMAAQKPTAPPDAIAAAPAHVVDYAGTQSTEGRPDLSGRDRFAWNVFVSWASYGVFIISGFILPRFIDRHVGQSALGVWDFAWSIISYFGLAQVGMGSTVNRYVAQYRSQGDVAGMNAAVSSVAFVLYGVALLVVALTLAAAWAVPRFLANELAGYAGDAQWVVLLLGLSLAFQQATDVYNGILTGCHRWDLHNAIHSGFHALQVIAMIVVLTLGGGLKSMAAVTLISMVASQMTRVVLCRRVCPELLIAWQFVTRDATRQMAVFGGKTFVPRLGELTMEQATSILIVPALGPAALAIFSRPKGLIRHVSTLVGKFSCILTPTAGSLHAAGDSKELARLLTRCTMFGAYMALPMVLLLVILGGPILQVWMGEHYARHNEGALILAIMAVGNLMTISQLPVISILQGMNAHGRPGLSKLVASGASVGLAFVMLIVLDMGLLGAAIAVTLPLAIADGLYVPWHACRELGLSFAKYLYEAWRGPIIAAVPFSAALLIGRMLMPSVTLLWLAVCAAPAGLVLTLTYWMFVLPVSAKAKVKEKLMRAKRSPA